MCCWGGCFVVSILFNDFHPLFRANDSKSGELACVSLVVATKIAPVEMVKWPIARISPHFQFIRALEDVFFITLLPVPASNL